MDAAERRPHSDSDDESSEETPAKRRKPATKTATEAAASTTSSSSVSTAHNYLDFAALNAARQARLAAKYPQQPTTIVVSEVSPHSHETIVEIKAQSDKQLKADLELAARLLEEEEAAEETQKKATSASALATAGIIRKDAFFIAKLSIAAEIITTNRFLVQEAVRNSDNAELRRHADFLAVTTKQEACVNEEDGDFDEASEFLIELYVARDVLNKALTAPHINSRDVMLIFSGALNSALGTLERHYLTHTHELGYHMLKDFVDGNVELARAELGISDFAEAFADEKIYEFISTLGTVLTVAEKTLVEGY